MFEYILHFSALLVFATSSFLLGLDALLSSLVFVSFLIGAFYRSWVISFSALIAYSTAIYLSSIPYDLFYVSSLTFFSLIPFFVCFRISSSKARGIIPIEALAPLIPFTALAFSMLFPWGPFFSIHQSVSPEGILLTSLIILLSLTILTELMIKVWGMIK